MEESYLSERNQPDNSSQLKDLCFPYGPLTKILEFLEMWEILNLRLLDSNFEDLCCQILSNREWSLEELFTLNTKTSAEYRRKLWWHKHREIITSVVGGKLAEYFDVVFVKYTDHVSTDYTERLFPLFVPVGKRGLTMKIVEHLFVLIFGNWPNRYPVGSRAYWHFNGKGAELIDFSFVREMGSSLSYRSETQLRTIPKGGKEYPFNTDRICCGISAQVKGIIHYQPNYGFGSNIIYARLHEGRSFTYVQNPTDLLLMTGKGAETERRVSLAELCNQIRDGKLFPHFYEVLDQRQHGGNTSDMVISQLFLDSLAADMKIVAGISRILEKKMEKEVPKLEYANCRHTISATRGQRYTMETYRYPDFQVYPMR